jgi:hypothetical protein
LIPGARPVAGGIGVWVFAKHSEHIEAGWSPRYEDVDDVAIDESGKITWRLAKIKTAPNLWNYIADFIGPA